MEPLWLNDTLHLYDWLKLHHLVPQVHHDKPYPEPPLWTTPTVASTTTPSLTWGLVCILLQSFLFLLFWHKWIAANLHEFYAEQIHFLARHGYLDQPATTNDLLTTDLNHAISREKPTPSKTIAKLPNAKTTELAAAAPAVPADTALLTTNAAVQPASAADSSAVENAFPAKTITGNTLPKPPPSAVTKDALLPSPPSIKSNIKTPQIAAVVQAMSNDSSVPDRPFLILTEVQAPTGSEPTGVEPTGVEPTGVEPTGVEPTSFEPTGVEPTGVEPTGVEPSAGDAELTTTTTTTKDVLQTAEAPIATSAAPALVTVYRPLLSQHKDESDGVLNQRIGPNGSNTDHQ